MRFTIHKASRVSGKNGGRRGIGKIITEIILFFPVIIENFPVKDFLFRGKNDRTPEDGGVNPEEGNIFMG